MTDPAYQAIRPGTLMAWWAVDKAARDGRDWVRRECLFPGLVRYYQRQGYEHFKLMLPFGDKNRSEVIRIGQRLGVDYVNTWSCHENTGFPCNRCEGCEERHEAFSAAGVKDPQLEAGGIKVPVRANRISVPI